MLTGPVPEQTEEILRSKIYNNFKDDHMSTTHFNFYSGEDQEPGKIEVSYNRKRKVIRIAADKKEKIVRVKRNLDDPSLFPIIFVLNTRNLKIAARLSKDKQRFELFLNG